MKNFILFIFLITPLFVGAQNTVGPEGYKLFWLLILVAGIIALHFIQKIVRKKNKYRPKRKFKLKRKKLQITLSKDRKIRPRKITVSFQNTGNVPIDLLAPLFIFKKLWTKRKFKIKKVNNREVYPLYMEPGKSLAFDIDLKRFHEHDRKLKRFYWGKIIITDVDGKMFRSKRIPLRKSLYT